MKFEEAYGGWIAGRLAQEEAKRQQGAMKALYRMGRPEIADEKEKSYLPGEAQPLERAARNVQAINADMREVRQDKTLTPEGKCQRLDELIVGKRVVESVCARC